MWQTNHEEADTAYGKRNVNTREKNVKPAPRAIAYLLQSHAPPSDSTEELEDANTGSGLRVSDRHYLRNGYVLSNVLERQIL